jgi:hypothetical protein
MTETIFAGKEIKKLALQISIGTRATTLAPFPGLTEDFFVGNRPCDARNRNGEEEKPRDFVAPIINDQGLMINA